MRQNNYVTAECLCRAIRPILPGGLPGSGTTNAYVSLGPRPKTNPSVDRFQYRTWGRKQYTPDEVWGRDYAT